MLFSKSTYPSAGASKLDRLVGHCFPQSFERVSYADRCSRAKFAGNFAVSDKYICPIVFDLSRIAYPKQKRIGRSITQSRATLSSTCRLLSAVDQRWKRPSVSGLTLEDALAHHGRSKISNTDQGSQFTGSAFTGVLASNGKGAWRDNVFVERL